MRRPIAGEPPGIEGRVSARILQLRDALEAYRSLPLEERLHRASADVPRPGGCLRPSSMPLNAAGTASVATYELQLKEKLPFVIVSIQNPSTLAVAQHLYSSGQDHLDAACLGLHIGDLESSQEEQSPWCAPIVVGANQIVRLEATDSGAAMPTTFITMRGYFVDVELAEACKLAGELVAIGHNKTFAAAAVMDDGELQLRINRPIDVERLVAKETLTGDAARAAFSLKIPVPRGMDREAEVQIFPFGKTIPSIGTKHAGARVDLQLRPLDILQMAPRYTSAGAAGTAQLQVTYVGRRLFC